jgi:general stress protein YciG
MMILLITKKRVIVGDKVNELGINILGWLAVVTTFTASAGLVVIQFSYQGAIRAGGGTGPEAPRSFIGNQVKEASMTSAKPSQGSSESSSTKQHGPAAGQKGVSQEKVGSGKKNDPNNFANDHERAAAAGRKGGKSHGS